MGGTRQFTEGGDEGKLISLSSSSHWPTLQGASPVTRVPVVVDGRQADLPRSSGARILRCLRAGRGITPWPAAAA
jgi:hypothetical protein